MAADEPDDSSDNVNVVVRVRPLTDIETAKADNHTLQFPGEGQILVEDPQSGQTRVFTYNVVFEPEATQEDIFEHCGLKRLIDMSIDGFASTIMAYGQTGAGKTYTMTGPEFYADEDTKGKIRPGVIQLSFAYLFAEIQQRAQKDCVVQASYLEVYNEHILDLLNPTTKPLPIRWSKDKGFYAENLFVVECEDLGDLGGVLEEGKKNRQMRGHEMNEHSSRSHTILTVYIQSEIKDPDDPNMFTRRQGKLSFVDLAGSEKTKKTNSKGTTLTEANNINKSLLVLGNCISSLADPKKRSGHIPYRDSALTKLLAESMGGTGMVLIIGCVSPSKSNASESINTLRYASRARRIRTKPMIRMDPRELLVQSLRREVKLLRMENTYLKEQINKGTTSNGTVASSDNIDLNSEEGPILSKYMTENNSLRAENANMHQMRELLIRDHEIVCRENERLLKRLREMERMFGNTEAPGARAMFGTPPSPPGANTPSSNSTGSWKQLHDTAKQPLPNKNMERPQRSSVSKSNRPSANKTRQQNQHHSGSIALMPKKNESSPREISTVTLQYSELPDGNDTNDGFTKPKQRFTSKQSGIPISTENHKYQQNQQQRRPSIIRLDSDTT